MEKLSFSWILPTGKINFPIFFNPLIIFQEINIYWKNFLFLQLNIMSVQKHWRIYFFFSSGKNFHSISWILPTGKITFSIFLLSHLFIFQEIKSLLENEKTNWFIFCNVPSAQNGKAAHGPHSRARYPRSPPRPGRNLGLVREFGLAAHPPGLKAGPFFHHRQISSDGCAVRSGRSKRVTGTLPRKP